MKLLQASLLVVALSPMLSLAAHRFTLTNRCSSPITPIIADTRCGYSPRCSDAASYTAAQPNRLAAGASQTVTIPSRWVGRIFAQNGRCGVKGESCSLTEFNLDSGDVFTPQSYDISNIQGFTQSLQINANGCESVTCTNVNCGCRSAYPPGDLSGCGNDRPVRACGAGDIAFSVVFCP
uniref:Thaumatin-like protein 12 n=1 Tax=Moniliophthora perniciosa TaxID=153609 RepID=A0A0K2FG26_MONPR|nr:thaumatin-like protein 12 [Moniliophthora perniciosa]